MNYSKVRPLSVLCHLDLCRQSIRYGCQREDSCYYAHSVIELKTWRVQQDTGAVYQTRAVERVFEFYFLSWRKKKGKTLKVVLALDGDEMAKCTVLIKTWTHLIHICFLSCTNQLAKKTKTMCVLFTGISPEEIVKVSTKYHDNSSKQKVNSVRNNFSIFAMICSNQSIVHV